MPSESIEPLFKSVRVTVPPSRHRVLIDVYHDHIETYVVDIPDGEFCSPAVPLIRVEPIGESADG